MVLLILGGALAAGSSLLALLSCVGAFGYVVTFGMCDDIHGGLWLWYVLLAYPAYAFAKWARAVWLAGAGTRSDWSVSLAIVAAILVIAVTRFEWTASRAGASIGEAPGGVATFVGFAFLAAYFFVSKASLRDACRSRRTAKDAVA